MRALKPQFLHRFAQQQVVTTQAREGIETESILHRPFGAYVTTQAREGIETVLGDSIEFMNLVPVPGKKV